MAIHTKAADLKFSNGGLPVFVFTTLLWLWLALPALAGPYRDSAHGNTSTGVSRASMSAAGYTRGNCGHCHEAHATLNGSEPAPTNPAGANHSLGFSPEEHLCLTCHDGSVAARNVKAEIEKTYRHPAGDHGARHLVSHKESGQSGAPFRGASRHAECVDCHNPHEARAGVHAYNTADAANNNNVSNVLKGVWGVEPASEPGWKSANVGYTEVNPATREYQICFKCHSYYALQQNSGITVLTGPSGELVTDQAMEFSRNLKSVHPVRTTLDNQTGSPATRRLATVQMKPPWNDAGRIGRQTMYCSDCHGTNASGATVARGPHGSTNRYLLAGANQEWPRASGNADHLWTLDDIRNNRYNWSTRLLCAKCHVLYSGGTWQNNVHAESKHNSTDRFDNTPWTTQYTGGVPCLTCHSVVPHGSPRSRLIAYRPNPNDAYAADPPYTLTDYKKANVNPNVIDGFKKNTRTGYQKKNCFITSNRGCGSHDSTEYSPFD